MKKWITSLNVLFLMFFPVIVQASRNDNLRQQVGIQIRNVLDPWILIACATMLLGIIAGAGMMILSGTNPRNREAGKSMVIGSGITITLLLSTYVILNLVLSIFGIHLF